MSAITEELEKINKVINELTYMLDETLKENKQLKEENEKMMNCIERFERMIDDWW